jgi:hypothetical protein
MEYKNYLSSLTVTNIKKICSYFNKHIKIVISKKTKDELIEHLLEHTEKDRNGNIIIKKKYLDNIKNMNLKKGKPQNTDSYNRYLDSLRK